jgi:hypothetical protein
MPCFRVPVCWLLLKPMGGTIWHHLLPLPPGTHIAAQTRSRRIIPSCTDVLGQFARVGCLLRLSSSGSLEGAERPPQASSTNAHTSATAACRRLPTSVGTIYSCSAVYLLRPVHTASYSCSGGVLK